MHATTVERLVELHATEVNTLMAQQEALVAHHSARLQTALQQTREAARQAERRAPRAHRQQQTEEQQQLADTRRAEVETLVARHSAQLEAHERAAAEKAQPTEAVANDL